VSTGSSRYRTYVLAIAAILIVLSFCTWTWTIFANPSISASVTRQPRIFFTDLTSGPNSGGAYNNGTILTIYGNRFGPARGRSSVTVGGKPAADYLFWSDAKVSIAIGQMAATGEVVVRTSLGSSNGVPFTVRRGRIYCVSIGGNDKNSGVFPRQCWATLVKAKNTMVAGDITYAMDGVTQTTLDGAKAALFINTSGAEGMPIALVAYPGARVNIGIPTWGDPNSPIRDAIRAGSSGVTHDWVIAGMHIQGIQAMDFAGSHPGSSDQWRFVGNDLTCPNGASEMPKGYNSDYGYEGYGCVISTYLTNSAVLGNDIHDTGTHCAAGLSSNGGNGDDACKLYHAVYFGTDSDHLEEGWNQIVPNGGGCRALQFHSTNGNDQYDLIVHDNVIHESVCDGINFATVDPSQGPVEAYNNVIYNAGMGPDPGGKYANYSCIYSGDETDAGNAGSGSIDIFDNTLYNCGANHPTNSAAIVKGGSVPTLRMNLLNNLVFQRNSEIYVMTRSPSPAAQITGANNLWHGVGPATAGYSFENNFDAYPQFVNLSRYDFRLRPDSPAIGVGVPIPGLVTDIDGVPRPLKPSLGAYEGFHNPKVSGR
jgi:hypothetical protein